MAINSKSPRENLIFKKTTDVTNKLPPQNIEAEQSLLGALLIDKDAIVAIAEILRVDHFYKSDQHGSIYAAILELFEKREPIDLVTVTEKLKQAGMIDRVGGSAYLTELVNKVPTAAHVESYAKIIREHAVRRQLISFSSRFIDMAYDEGIEVSNVLEEAEQSVFSIAQQHVKRDFIQLRDALAESFDRLDDLQKTSGKLRGVPTGFRDLDAKLAGLQNSNLIIFAARPGMGKCLAYDSKIVHPETGEMITIEQYYHQKITPILTLSPDLKLSKTNISHFVNDGKKEVFEVTTATGRKIEVTASHPFLTINGWKKLFEISVGERVATPREIPIFGQGELEDFKVKAIAFFLTDGGLTHVNPRFTNSNPVVVNDFVDSINSFPNVSIKEYNSNHTRVPSYQVIKAPINKVDITIPFSANLKTLIKDRKVTQYVLASQLNASPATVSLWKNGYSMPSENNLNLLAAYFDRPKEDFIPDNFFGFSAKNSVTRYLTQLGLMGKSALEKSVPSIIFTLPKEKIALFLNRAFACDGCVYFKKKGVTISYASSSKEMIFDFQHLLLRFGILSKVRSKNIKYKESIRLSYELEIHDSKDVLAFCQNIGILGKQEKIKRAMVCAMNSQKNDNFTKDTLPVEIWKEILKAKGDTSWRKIYQQLGLPLSHNMHVGKRNPKRSTVLKLAKVLDSERLEALATSDIFWDKIISIKSMGIKQVYDLTISETHNFMANDFFVHNTSFALNIAQHAAVVANIPVGIFSLEMSQEELVDRLLVAQADIDAWKLKTGRLDDKDFDKLSHAMGQLAEAPLFIDDTPGLSISEMRTKARRLQSEHGLKMLIVDYLQLMRGRGLENRVQEVSEISQSLKNLARELKIPVFALSQLSRNVESRGGVKKPQLADLRDSGAIEQDADVVMFIYREDGDNFEAVKLDIQKHRNGPLGEIDLIFRGDRLKFYGMEKTRRVSQPKDEPVKAAAAA